jgi:mRNA interferase MazF
LIWKILPIVNVLPITSRKPERMIYPNEVLLPSGTGGLDKESIVLCHQIRTLDKRRLIKDMGRIEDIDFQEEIIEALCFQLGVLR